MALSLTDDYVPGLNREWHRLQSAGTWWTGAQRVAIAAVARAARNSEPTPDVELPPPAITAAARLSADPHVDAHWLADLEAEGLAAEPYVEVLGVVARLNAVDTFIFGIGGELQPLPDPLEGEPSREQVEGAAMSGGLVPTVGPASAPNSLSAVEAESAALLDLHGVLYLSLEEMGDLGIVKDLTRAQLEFVAARTSLITDCFF